MKIFNKIFKWFGIILLIPIIYLLLALLFSKITVNKNRSNQIQNYEIFLSTNGVHLDIILPIKNIDTFLLKNTNYNIEDTYFSYGWGDENFYLNTPNWSDLTFKNALNAMFLKSPTLMHVTRYKNAQKDWISVSVSKEEFDKIQFEINKSFKKDLLGNSIIMSGESYQVNDSFYKANGSYSCIYTCNSWANNILKNSGLKAAFWTPFDFGVLDKYKE